MSNGFQTKREMATDKGKEHMTTAYNRIDRILREKLSDDDYPTYKEELDAICQAKKYMKPYGYVWTKDKHEPKFFWTEGHAKDLQKQFGGEVVAVYK